MSDAQFKNALEFGMHVINDPNADLSDKIRVMSAILPYQHARLAEVGQGKKEQAEAKAKEAAGGRFGAAAPPKLVAIAS